MKQGFFLGLVVLAVVVLLAPNCGEDSPPEDDIFKELAQVWEGERFTRNSTGQILTHETLYMKLTTEMTYIWAYQNTLRRSPDPDTVTNEYREEGAWDLNTTEDALLITPEGGSAATAPFVFAGDTLVVNYKEGEWRLQWTFSSRSDWW